MAVGRKTRKVQVVEKVLSRQEGRQQVRSSGGDNAYRWSQKWQRYGALPWHSSSPVYSSTLAEMWC